ncbi:patatin-like phospholipase family protein [uncultured Brachyspira sp.]|uniref:patatin-like phospholipase family protein n=1 Tax=uncultured Brachyspira sp. TaxID=221953 RepID=UPI00259B532D|nr:patatin-like phospholipase family protein [uncultured Brachyspira sp.]
MDKLGIVLDGGGGKGAYQIGVWKYLKESKLYNSISAISGTSVGGLNSCLFALDEYNLAETIWTQKIQDKILSIDIDIKEICGKIALQFGIQNFVPGASIISFFTMLSTSGCFSRKGLIEIIDEYIDLNKLSKMEFPIYATCVELPLFETRYFKLNGYYTETIKKILLATSAIPIIFPKEEIEGKYYYDGGIKDNSPITPLYEEGCTDIIVIHLKADEILKDRREGVNIYEICPQEDLGNFFKGTLDFSTEGVYRRIEQGYRDAKEILSPVVDIAKAGAGIIKDLDMMREHEKIFKENRKALLEERKLLKSNLNDNMEKFANIGEAKKFYLEEEKRKNIK